MLNAVDATYRSDLRELSEATFARFDAKMEQRLGQFRSSLESRMDQRFSAVDGRFAVVDAQFSKVTADLSVLRADIRADLKSMEAKLVKWMFLFWAGTALAGLLLQ
jgi:DNA-binding transcriptional regulator YbjK